MSRLGVRAAMRRIAVQETGVSRHHKAPIEGPKTAQTIIAPSYWGVSVDHNCSPIMTRDASISDIGCHFL